jgi:branched-chain amino acid transport system substrate-binding protein
MVARTVKVLCVLAALMFLIGTMAGPVLAEKIKVGIVLPLTGKLGKFGEVENKSFLMALEEINAAGGVNGKQIELIIEDTTGKPDVGRSAIEKLISQDNVVVVGGGYSSSVTWATSAVAQQHKVPFLVNTGSADRITERGWNYIFRLNSPVSEYPKAFGSFLKKVATDVRTVAILHENSSFGRSGTKRFLKTCKGLGVKILMKEGYEAGAIDFKPLIEKVKDKTPDLVYMISSNLDASLLMRQSRELGFNPKLFFGGTAGFTLPEFQENAGDASDFVFSETLWTPSVPYPGAKAYYDRYLAKYNSPTEYHGAEAYAAMYVIADALKRAKSLSREDVRNALAATAMMTVFGPVKFVSYNKKTQQNRLPTFLVQWINGKLETIWPTAVSTHKYVYPVPVWNNR